MTAHVLNIAERHLRTPDRLASLADFTCAEGGTVDPAVVLDDPDLSLYCLDDAGKRAVFAQLPPGTDLTAVPFVYLTQGEGAERLITVSYDVFLELAAKLPQVEKLIVVYGTGRSGSTLLSHVFNASGAAVSLSEPDVTDQFAFLRNPDGSRDRELSELLEGVVRFLFTTKRYKQAAAYALKLRAEGIRAVEFYQKTFPASKNLLLYRDALGWVASFYRVFRDLGVPEREPTQQWVEYLEWSLKRTPGEVRAYLGEDEDVPLVKALALWWLFLMENCLEQHERGVTSLAVRYDDLNRQRERVLHEVFTYCGLPLAAVEKGLGAFGPDSQRSTPLARADPKQGSALRLSEGQLAEVYGVLARHPVVNAPDFVLPGTLTL